MPQPVLQELNRPLPPGPDVALLVFTLGPQRLGLPAEQVGEIIRAVAIAPDQHFLVAQSGMLGEAVATGLVDQVLTTDEIAERLAELRPRGPGAAGG